MAMSQMSVNLPQYGVEPPAVVVDKRYSKDQIVAGLKADGATKIYLKRDGEDISVIGHFDDEIRTITLTPDGMFIHLKKLSTPYPGPDGSTE